MLSLFLSLLLQCRIFFALHFAPNTAFPKPLAAEEETQLFKQMQQETGSLHKAAKDMLVLHNLRLVAHVIKKYYTVSESPEDLQSIGTVGLIKAIDSFDPHKKIRFATYAAKCIENATLSQMSFWLRKELPIGELPSRRQKICI